MNYGTAPTPAGFGCNMPSAYQSPVSSASRETLPMINRCGDIQSQEVSQNPAWSYNMVPHDMVRHGRHTQRDQPHHGMR